MEEWKDIEGYDGDYKISNLGRAFSLKRSKPFQLKNMVDSHGYLQVELFKNGERKHFRVHRLVAIHFIPNPENLEFVNHIDHDKTNNSIENLEWCTALENNLARYEFYGEDREKNFCECGKEIAFENKSCRNCYLKNPIHKEVERPSPSQLEKELRESNFSRVGKKYGVSDNAIRKWCKVYGMPTSAKYYK